jgi:chorismate synthase
MSYNSFGRVFRFMTWGESHGPGLGVVIDGCPPGIALEESDIQPWMDKRRPGQSRHTTQRREPDAVKIMSGVYEGRTTGTPIHLMIDNVDQRSKDYSQISAKYRPGHADYTYDAKYGFRDPRGGGRSSARETAARVAAGAVARKVLGDGIGIRAYLTELGGIPIDRARFDDAAIDANGFFCPDPVAAGEWETAVDTARKDGNSLGAVAECVATGVPAGWGAPVYAKLDGEIAAAMMSINATKGVEIGNGFEAARITGRDNADEMAPGNEGPRFLSNNAGGVLGGISNGDTIVCRTAFKPTSSVLTPLKTVTRDGEATEISTKGRHDPCVGIRGVPVVEAMMALVLADQMLLHRAQCS